MVTELINLRQIKGTQQINFEAKIATLDDIGCGDKSVPTVRYLFLKKPNIKHV